MIPTVAALTDQGPRAENEDRCFAALDSADGSWLIAVSDGLGGHDRGAEAAAAAVEGLPARCASLGELQDAFAGAERRVESLSDVPRGWRDLRRVPMSTLCAASWSPTGGLHVGQTGDTVAVLIRLPRRARPRARLVFLPHRTGYGTISSCLGLTNLDSASTDSWASLELDAAAAHTLIILSDGTWEPLDRDAETGGRFLCDALERLADRHHTATETAQAVLDAAVGIGLDDNATVAVAHIPATRHRGDPRLTSEDRASLTALIEGDEFLDELDATGDTIHGNDAA